MVNPDSHLQHTSVLTGPASFCFGSPTVPLYLCVRIQHRQCSARVGKAQKCF